MHQPFVGAALRAARKGPRCRWLWRLYPRRVYDRDVNVGFAALGANTGGEAFGRYLGAEVFEPEG